MKEKYREPQAYVPGNLICLGGQGGLPGERMTFQLRSEEVKSALES